MSQPLRISAKEVLRRQHSERMLIVCAYDDPTRCLRIGVPGALQLSTLVTRLRSLEPDHPIALYCS